MKMCTPVTFKLFCVRHGQTQANVEKRMQGCTDTSLSAVGIEQAKLAGKALNKVKFDRAYASPLSRALETCQHILNSNDHASPQIKLDSRLKERNFGDLEGLTYDECLKIAAAAGESWTSYVPPGAETTADVERRCILFFKEMCQSIFDKIMNENNSASLTDSNETSSKCVLLVSHGFSLNRLYRHFEKNLKAIGMVEVATQAITPNTGISEFLVNYSPKKCEIECIRLHDGKHIEN